MPLENSAESADSIAFVQAFGPGKTEEATCDDLVESSHALAKALSRHWFPRMRVLDTPRPHDRPASASVAVNPLTPKRP